MIQKITYGLIKDFQQCPERFWFKLRQQPIEQEQDLSHDFFREQRSLLELKAIQYFKEKGYTPNQKVQFWDDFFEMNLDLCWESSDKYISFCEVHSHYKLNLAQQYEMAFKVSILLRLGYRIQNIFSAHLNSNYIKKEKGETESKILHFYEVKKKVMDLVPEISQTIEVALDYGLQTEIDYSRHSCKSKNCPVFSQIHPQLQESNLNELRGIDKETILQLLSLGIHQISEIPLPLSKNKIQQLQIKLSNSSQPIIYKKELRAWIKQVKYPIYFIDYEATTSFIPIYKNSSPQQHIVFQYSLHILENPLVEPIHKEYIADGNDLPYLELLTRLKQDIQDQSGSILVWHDSFEKARNNEMAAYFPAFKDFITSVNNRIIDLEKVFLLENGFYFHPACNGKSSIKKILPAIFPEEETYSQMQISDGMSAAIHWHRYLTKELSDEEKQRIKKDLLNYCKMDTFALYKIFKHLWDYTSNLD
jgi:hypothetical protein